MKGDIRKRVQGVFKEISKNHEFDIDTLEVSEEHGHIFLSFPPIYSISKVVEIMKSISASVIFKEYPEARQELWGGGF